VSAARWTRRSRPTAAAPPNGGADPGGLCETITRGASCADLACSAARNRGGLPGCARDCILVGVSASRSASRRSGPFRSRIPGLCAGCDRFSCCDRVAGGRGFCFGSGAWPTGAGLASVGVRVDPCAWIHVAGASGAVAGGGGVSVVDGAGAVLLAWACVAASDRALGVSDRTAVASDGVGRCGGGRPAPRTGRCSSAWGCASRSWPGVAAAAYAAGGRCCRACASFVRSRVVAAPVRGQRSVSSPDSVRRLSG